MKAKALIPLIIFLLLAGLFFFTLKKINQGEYNPRHVPSPFIGKQAPPFSIADLHQPATKVDPSAMRGQVWLLNVWGTWCNECWREHEYLLHLAKNKGVKIIGVNWRDDPQQARAMIAKLGNPFLLIADDQAGNVAIDWGVYGAPETFVIDKRGIIRLKFEGPLSEAVWQERFAPLMSQLEGEAP